MTIAATYSKIVELVAGTSGIALAQEELPISLTESDLPCALVRVGAGTWNEHATGLYRQVRTYYVDVYVRPIAEGVVPDEGYKACLTPLHNLGWTFVTNMDLDGVVDGIGGGFSDTGVKTLIHSGGREYYGFTLTLNITEKAT